MFLFLRQGPNYVFLFFFFKDAIEFILCWPYTGGRVATLFFFSVYSFLLLDILYLTMYF